MSELTPCNYCNLRSIKRRAKEDGLQVSLLGSDVYVHPPDVVIENLTDETQREAYWQAWMMEITARCVC